jgi:hypothetical protein
MRNVYAVASIIVLGCANDSGSDDGGSTGTADTSASGPSSVDDGPPTTNEPTAPTMPSTADDDDTNADSSAGPATEDTAESGDSTGGDDGPNVDVSDPQLYEFELDPLELDPTVVDNIELQYAHLDTRVEPIGKLVFFLSGYTNTPASWRNHGQQIAGWGFHVVEPHYNNSWDCGDMGGSCGTDSRWEALVGEDVSQAIVASRADSAEGRVVTMLLHLAEVHPQGDWGWFLDDENNLRYEHVVIAGISHGASSSGLFATRRPFMRAVMHSGGWWEVDDSSVTPIELFYGLAHVDDEQYAGITSAWGAAGMLGSPTSIDDATPPYDDARQLITAVPNGYPHCSVCVSGDSPMEGDAYVFDPAWRYMYGAPQLE